MVSTPLYHDFQGATTFDTHCSLPSAPIDHEATKRQSFLDYHLLYAPVKDLLHYAYDAYGFMDSWRSGCLSATGLNKHKYETRQGRIEQNRVGQCWRTKPPTWKGICCSHVPALLYLIPSRVISKPKSVSGYRKPLCTERVASGQRSSYQSAKTHI